jgi:hypothetical protein
MKYALRWLDDDQYSCLNNIKVLHQQFARLYVDITDRRIHKMCHQNCFWWHDIPT